MSNVHRSHVGVGGVVDFHAYEGRPSHGRRAGLRRKPRQHGGPSCRCSGELKMKMASLPLTRRPKQRMHNMCPTNRPFRSRPHHHHAMTIQSLVLVLLLSFSSNAMIYLEDIEGALRYDALSPAPSYDYDYDYEYETMNSDSNYYPFKLGTPEHYLTWPPSPTPVPSAGWTPMDSSSTSSSDATATTGIPSTGTGAEEGHHANSSSGTGSPQDVLDNNHWTTTTTNNINNNSYTVIVPSSSSADQNNNASTADITTTSNSSLNSSSSSTTDQDNNASTATADTASNSTTTTTTTANTSNSTQQDDIDTTTHPSHPSIFDRRLTVEEEEGITSASASHYSDSNQGQRRKNVEINATTVTNTSTTNTPSAPSFSSPPTKSPSVIPEITGEFTSHLPHPNFHPTSLNDNEHDKVYTYFDDLKLINSLDNKEYVYYDSKQARFGVDLGPKGNAEYVNLMLPPRWGGGWWDNEHELDIDGQGSVDDGQELDDDGEIITTEEEEVEEIEAVMMEEEETNNAVVDNNGLSDEEGISIDGHVGKDDIMNTTSSRPPPGGILTQGNDVVNSEQQVVTNHTMMSNETDILASNSTLTASSGSSTPTFSPVPSSSLLPTHVPSSSSLPTLVPDEESERRRHLRHRRLEVKDGGDELLLALPGSKPGMRNDTVSGGISNTTIEDIADFDNMTIINETAGLVENATFADVEGSASNMTINLTVNVDGNGGAAVEVDSTNEYTEEEPLSQRPALPFHPLEQHSAAPTAVPASISSNPNHIADYFCLQDFVNWKVYERNNNNSRSKLDDFTSRLLATWHSKSNGNNGNGNLTAEDATAEIMAGAAKTKPTTSASSSSAQPKSDSSTADSDSEHFFPSQNPVTDKEIHSTRPISILVKRGRCTFEDKARMAMVLNELFAISGRSNRIEHIVIYNNGTATRRGNDDDGEEKGDDSDVTEDKIEEGNEMNEEQEEMEKLIDMTREESTLGEGTEIKVGLLYIATPSGKDLSRRIRERELLTGINPHLDVGMLFSDNSSGNSQPDNEQGSHQKIRRIQERPLVGTRRLMPDESKKDDGDYHGHISDQDFDNDEYHDEQISHGWFFPATLTRFCLSCGRGTHYGLIWPPNDGNGGGGTGPHGGGGGHGGPDVSVSPKDGGHLGPYDYPPGRYGFDYTYATKPWLEVIRKLMITILSVLLIGPLLLSARRWYTVGGTFRVTYDEVGRRRIRVVSPNLEVFVNGVPGTVETNGTKLDRSQVFMLPEVEYVGTAVDGEEEGEDLEEENISSEGDRGEQQTCTVISADLRPSSSAPCITVAPSRDTATNRFVSSTTCSICIDEFVPGERVRVLPRCDHAFHTECILPWLTERQGCCPMCKIPVLPDELQRPRGSRNRRRNGRMSRGQREGVFRSLRGGGSRRQHQPQSSPVVVGAQSSEPNTDASTAPNTEREGSGAIVRLVSDIENNLEGASRLQQLQNEIVSGVTLVSDIENDLDAAPQARLHDTVIPGDHPSVTTHVATQVLFGGGPNPLALEQGRPGQMQTTRTSSSLDGGPATTANEDRNIGATVSFDHFENENIDNQGSIRHGIIMADTDTNANEEALTNFGADVHELPNQLRVESQGPYLIVDDTVSATMNEDSVRDESLAMPQARNAVFVGEATQQTGASDEED